MLIQLQLLHHGSYEYSIGTKPESLFMDALAWGFVFAVPAGVLLGALGFYLVHRCWWHPEHYDYDLVEV